MGYLKNQHPSSRNAVFRFKQFEVDQTGCAMKINTDGVLLAAMAAVPVPEKQNSGRPSILDIGTGTGVVALMLAQRFPSALLDAIEIDPEAAERAGSNFLKSPFVDRLQVQPVSLQDYCPEPATGKYHLIVSNPPFFVDALPNPDHRKQLARHTDFDFFHTLLRRSQQWLLPGGHLQLILPPELANSVEATGLNDYGFELAGRREIFSFAKDEKPVRVLLTMQKGKVPATIRSGTERWVIYQARGTYSEAYKALLKDFFLAF